MGMRFDNPVARLIRANTSRYSLLVAPKKRSAKNRIIFDTGPPIAQTIFSLYDSILVGDSKKPRKLGAGREKA